MKNLKLNLRLATLLAAIVSLVLTLLPQPARAQGSFDAFSAMRTLIVQQPTNILYQAAVFGATNAAVDIRLMTGTVKLDISAATNVPGTLTGGVQVSTDNTNWTALQNYAIANPTKINYTNLYYGTNTMIVTNTWNLDGTNTTPTAATSGFASTYIIPAPFTNTAATFTLAAPNGVTTIAFRADDQPRYLRCYWNVGGTGTNVTVSATLTGRSLTSTLTP